MRSVAGIGYAGYARQYYNKRRWKQMTNMTFKCSGCNHSITLDDHDRELPVTCPFCSRQITVPLISPEITDTDAKEFASRVSARISHAVGVEKLDGFSLKAMFSKVLSKHSNEEIEQYFGVGGPETTPTIDNIDASWPRPWLFFRTLLITVVFYVCLVLAWNEFRNLIIIPTLIMMGSFALPFSTLLFFFESNVRRNVSLFQINQLVIFGGILSMIISLTLDNIISTVGGNWIGASFAAFIEEPSKLLVLAVIINNKKYPFILNGLLFGAAVGAGFAALESAGYAFLFALEFGSSAMKDVILTRGMLAPFTHIAWTSMCAAALWRVKGGSRFSFVMIKDMKFFRVFVAAVVLHTLWNSSINLPFYGKYIILGVISWIIVFGLLQEGLKQLRAQKSIRIDPIYGQQEAEVQT
jgi:protease PrsW